MVSQPLYLGWDTHPGKELALCRFENTPFVISAWCTGHEFAQRLMWSRTSAMQVAHSGPLRYNHLVEQLGLVRNKHESVWWGEHWLLRVDIDTLQEAHIVSTLPRLRKVKLILRWICSPLEVAGLRDALSSAKLKEAFADRNAFK